MPLSQSEVLLSLQVMISRGGIRSNLNMIFPLRYNDLFLISLFSAYEYVIPAHGKECVKTDLSISIPSGTYGRVAPRSGLAAKNFIDTGAGVIDEDYRGNVMVLLFNHSDVDFKGKRWEK